MNDFLKTPIEYLKGVGPQRADLLKKEIFVYTFEDLISYYPFRYVDRSFYCKINEIPYLENAIQFRGIVTKIYEGGHGRRKTLSVIVQDDSGKIELIWFQGVNWVKTH